MTEPDATTPDTPAPQPAGLVDLSDLRMMPAWVAGMGSTSNLNKYAEREERGPRRGGDSFDRRGGPPRRDGGGPGRDRGDFRPRGDRRDGPPGRGRDRQERGPRRFDNRDEGRPQREWVEIPKDINVVIEPEDKAAEMLANHIRSSGHAFSMFDAARLVLGEGDRFHARFSCAAERATGLFVTPADGGLFLSRDEALNHILRGSALETYYRAEEIELEEPKGDFKSIGVCGFSGELLGPPSHHSFQTALLRLHRERFNHLPLEDYKRRVRVETSEDLVARWKEQQRKGRRWTHLAAPEGAEPVTFNSRGEVEAHFRRTHADDAVHEAREVVIPGNHDKAKMSHVLFLLLRNAVENARRHLFEMSQKLGGGFERRGLKLFKRRAGKLFVCRVKPRAVDPGVVFSERIARIVEVLKGASGMPLAKLVDTLLPVAEAAAAPADAPPAAEGDAKPALSDEQIAVLKDIRWLTNEGYVIEYSDGMVFLGVQGEPQPPKAAAGKAAVTEPAAESATETASEEVLPTAAPAGSEPAGEAPAEEAPATATTPEVVAPEVVVTETPEASDKTQEPAV